MKNKIDGKFLFNLILRNNYPAIQYDKGYYKMMIILSILKQRHINIFLGRILNYFFIN